MPSSSAARQHASLSVRDGTQRDACCMQPAMKHKQSAKSLVGHQIEEAKRISVSKRYVRTYLRRSGGKRDVVSEER